MKEEQEKLYSALEARIGKKITMLSMSDFGFPSILKCVLHSVEKTTYAQYDHALVIIYKQKHKRSLRKRWLYGQAIKRNKYWDNWVNLNPEVIWDKHESTNNCIVRSATSFDSNHLDVVAATVKEKPFS